MKGGNTMPRGRKKTTNYDEVIQQRLEKIEELKMRITGLSKEIQELENEKRQAELQNLQELINGNGLTADDVRSMIESRLEQEELRDPA